MNHSRLILCLFLSLISIKSYAWGDKGHKLIAEKSLTFLSEEMKLPKSYSSFIIEHSTDADTRKSSDKSEGSKHFLDIDFYAEYNSGTEILNKDSLIQKYGTDTVTRKGLLPWATIETYNNLVKSFKADDVPNIKQNMADLAHYVADAHQAMHSTDNYNGQLTGQKGIHARYEIEMVDKYLSEIKSRIVAIPVAPINNLEQSLFSIIRESNCVLPVLFSADKIASAQTNKQYNEAYYRLMWFYTEFVTIDEITKASNRLASIYYMAWQEAGKPVING